MADVVILGGTQFVGRHIAGAFAEHGHRVALFNRGSNPGVHADLDQMHGDRAHDLERLNGRTWEAVVDVCGYTPDVVETSARYFKDRAGQYVFVSSISVYDYAKTDGPAEDAPLLQFPADEDPTVRSDERYGALKALCEEAVQRSFAGRVTILRPGLVAGPYDPTDRFTYWPVRFDNGGTVLAPPSRTRIQYIDARDLAAFAVHLVDRQISGIFNCTVPRSSLTFGDLYAACAHETAKDASTLCVSDEFLDEHAVAPWSELPLWLPAGSDYAGITNAASAHAQAAGLRIRSLRNTVHDTLAWARIVEKRLGNLKAGLAPAREAELLREAQQGIAG